MLKLSKRMMLIAFLASATIISCEKKEAVKAELQNVKKADISALRHYFAERVNVKDEEVTYNDKTQQFSVFGVEQVSLERLKLFYSNSKKQD